MSKAYQVVFECPKGGHKVSLQRKSPKTSPSEVDAKPLRLARKSVQDEASSDRAFQLDILLASNVMLAK
jgi:hypothetical protein